MCGIYGYIGNTTINKFVDKLSLLEYRGYDSCGIAYNYNNHIILIILFLYVEFTVFIDILSFFFTF